MRIRAICAVAVVRDGAVVYETRGCVEGEITRPPRGSGGFGYDPIFYYPPYGCTLAEVTQTSKLTVAHRGQAFRALANWLTKR
jgi:XTP/dITP diphosphohydrolase